MNHDLRVDTEIGDDTLVVRVVGDIDLGTVDVFEASVAKALEKSFPSHVALDLTNVGFLGTAGLTVLIWLIEQSEKTQATLWIVADSRMVLRPLEIAGIDKRARLVSTMSEVTEAEAPTT